MKIYIPKDSDSQPIGLFLSDDKQKVEIALAAIGTKYVSLEEMDPNDNDLGIHGLVFVLTSEEKVMERGIGAKRCRIWKRGR